MRSNATAHPLPVGDWAENPTDGSRAPSRAKWRTKLHRLPSVEVWNAYARPILAMRSHTDPPSTTNELQSSDMPRVTTDTTIGSRCGEYSKQSFAHTSSLSCSMSTP